MGVTLWAGELLLRFLVVRLAKAVLLAVLGMGSRQADEPRKMGLRVYFPEGLPAVPSGSAGSHITGG